MSPLIKLISIHLRLNQLISCKTLQIGTIFFLTTCNTCEMFAESVYENNGQYRSYNQTSTTRLSTAYGSYHGFFEDDPYMFFTVGENQTNEVKITWIAVEDIQKSCDAESKKRGKNGFPYAVDACSFWGDKRNSAGSMQRTCFIFTSAKTNTHTLGHEMRHCFQGEYHK